MTPPTWPPDLSPDGRHTWDGSAWRPNQVSPDGRHYLYRNAWHPLPQAGPPAASTAPLPAPPVPSGPTLPGGPTAPARSSRLGYYGLGLALLAGALVVAKGFNIFNTSGGICVLAFDDPASQTPACAGIALRELALIGLAAFTWLVAAMCALVAVIQRPVADRPSRQRPSGVATFVLVAVQVVALYALGTTENTITEYSLTGKAELSGALTVRGASETRLGYRACEATGDARGQITWNFQNSVEHPPFTIQVQREGPPGRKPVNFAGMSVQLHQDRGQTSPVVQRWIPTGSTKLRDLTNPDGTGTITFTNLTAQVVGGPNFGPLSGRIDISCATNRVSKY